MSDAAISLSVVIAASGDAASLARCLTSLEEQTAAGDVEVIVASNLKGSDEGWIKRRFPFATYLGLAQQTIIPELRAEGARRARGAIIALLEDNCFVDRHWCDEIKKAHALPHAAIGGAVANESRQRSFDWAVYLSDYGRYMPPLEPGAAVALPGNNLSYKRQALESVNQTWAEGIFETFLNDELKRRGQHLYLAPAAIVYHCKSYDAVETLIRYYHHGRGYGGMRITGVLLTKRLLLIAGSIFLPVLLPGRIALRALRRGGEKKAICWSLPSLFLLMACWSLGEFCGYLFGAGASTRRWR